MCVCAVVTLPTFVLSKTISRKLDDTTSITHDCDARHEFGVGLLEVNRLDRFPLM